MRSAPDFLLADRRRLDRHPRRLILILSPPGVAPTPRFKYCELASDSGASRSAAGANASNRTLPSCTSTTDVFGKRTRGRSESTPRSTGVRDGGVMEVML